MSIKPKISIKGSEGLWCPGTVSVSISGWTDLEPDDLISAVQNLVQQIELSVNGVSGAYVVVGDEPPAGCIL